ncbi:MAG: hypothetical protein GX196_02605 [Clostridiaceae bacterium]|nr:hypothetical protein [Clostridiaceae bacterium]
MEELYIKTKDGLIPLSQEMIKKYNLKKGVKTPFTGDMVVDKNKNADLDINWEEKKDNRNSVTNTTDIIFQTSEVIDIAKGVDSD